MPTTTDTGRLQRYSLKTSLLTLAALCVLPATLVNIWLVYDNLELRRSQAQQNTLLMARQVAAELDTQLSVIESGLRVLSTAPELLQGDLAGFHRRAKEALVVGTVANYILTDRQGHQIINTLVPYGKPLPTTGTPAQLDKVFTHGHSVLTDLFIGPVTRRHVIAMGVPVYQDGAVVYSLNIGLAPDRLNKLVDKQNLPTGWLISILDSKGVIAGRSRDPDQFVGQTAVPALQAALGDAPETHLRIPTKEGHMAFAALKHLDKWGWSVAVGVQENALNAAVQPLVWRVVAVTAAALGMGLLLALGLARRVLSTVHDINAACKALHAGEVVRMPTVEFREAEAIGEALRQAAQDMQQIMFAAKHDPLTQLANRSLFTEIAEHQIALCQRHGHTVAIVAIDLDHFKDVNDTLGHAVGDDILVEAARRIQAEVRTSDTVARLGGDEFLVLLTATDHVHAEATAHRIVEALSATYRQTSIRVSASAGVSLYPTHGAVLDVLIASADHALYRAKEAGRHCVRVASA